MHTLLLDFGNVVAYFDHRRATRRLADLPGARISEAEIHQQVFAGALEPDFDTGRMGTETFLEHLRAITHTRATDTELIDAWTDIFWRNEPMERLLPRVKRAGLRLVLASNTNALHAERIFKEFAEPLAHFDDFVLSFQIGARKPDRAFFDVCLDRARAGANECLFADDKPDNVEAARRLGIPASVYGDHELFVAELRHAGVDV